MYIYIYIYLRYYIAIGVYDLGSNYDAYMSDSASRTAQTGFPFGKQYGTFICFRSAAGANGSCPLYLLVTISMTSLGVPFPQAKLLL